ncbi:MAG: metal-dependent hydrolase [Abitibacteriaceae bacterium]|nr:metal-dependent hydrolase [Abditibacteriaceae bacterium]
MKQCVSLPDVNLAPLASRQTTKDANLKRQLHQRLHHLSYSAFACLVQQALECSGFSQVYVLNPHYSRGRSAHGGLDMNAYTATDVTSSLTVVQIKQYHRSVPRRFVDELRGVMMRTGARHGLLITTSDFAQVACKAAAGDEVAPIQLIDGAALTELLLTHKLGVREDKSHRLALNKQFFRRLETAVAHQRTPNPHTGRVAATAKSQPEKSTQKRFAQAKFKCNNLVFNAPDEDRLGGDMTWSTHVLFGINSLWLLDALPPAPDVTNFALLVAVAAFGALLPDLDAAESKLKHLRIGGIKPFFLPAQFVHRQLGHRGLAHSLSGLIILALMSLPLIAWWGWLPSLALVLGYASHLAADALTKSGIPFFYPSHYRYHLLPLHWRFTTGSQAEEMLFPFLVMAVLLLLLRHLAYMAGMPATFTSLVVP